MSLSMRARPLVAVATAAALFMASVPIGAHAALVPTDAVIAVSGAEAERVRVAEFLDREEVRRQMQSLGVSPQEAQARVAALSDAEIRQIAGRLEDMPAGGDAIGVILGTALVVFIVLLITDIAGLTKVFPFTRAAR